MIATAAPQTVSRYRGPAFLGAGIGSIIVLALAAYWVYGIAVTPAIPVAKTASAGDMVAFVSNPRGLAQLSRIEQDKFLASWKQSLIGDPERKEELKKRLESLDEKERSAFADVVFGQFKRNFMDDAKQYSRLAETERYKFVRERLEAYTSDALFLKDLAMAFKSKFVGGPDEQQKWMMEHSTAEERAIGEPYVNDLQKIREQVRKETRPAPATKPDAPAATKPKA